MEERNRTYKFRIYPDEKRKSAIDENISLAQRFYNKILEKSMKEQKVSMKAFNIFAKEIIEEDPSYMKLYSQTRCEIRYRVLKAYQNFFRRLGKAARRKGFPKFKSYNKYRSITYPQDNGSFYIERIRGFNRLRITRIGTMRIELHRSIGGKIKTLTIAREGKNYFAIFTVEENKGNIPEVENTNPVGIDLGLNNFIALSDGRKVEKPKFFKRKEKRIALWQKRMSRRERKSKRRQKAKEKLRQEWNAVTRRSEDFAHRLSYELANAGYTSFAIEDLHIQNMVKDHRLAQSIHNASWRRFINFLQYKAERKGIPMIRVDPENTSKECSNCGNIMEMPLSHRVFNCHRCRLQLDRDVNASINILKRATFGQKESHAQGENVRPHQEATLEELRTYPANAGEAHML